MEGSALKTLLYTSLSHLVWRAPALKTVLYTSLYGELRLSQQFCSHHCHILYGGLRSQDSFGHIIVTSCMEGSALVWWTVMLLVMTIQLLKCSGYSTCIISNLFCVQHCSVLNNVM